MVQDCSTGTAMNVDRLCGVLVAQQKVVPDEKFADLVSGEGGRRVGFESQDIYLNHIKTFSTGSALQSKGAVRYSVPLAGCERSMCQHRRILSVFLYGIRDC